MTASDEDIEKKGVTAVAADRGVPVYDDVAVGTSEISPLKRSLQGRHMQMIAIGMCFDDSLCWCSS
jgi:amino acid permease